MYFKALLKALSSFECKDVVIYIHSTMRSLTVSFVVILLLAIYCYEEVYGRVYFNIIPLLENKYGGFLKSSSSSKFTSFENYSKYRIWILAFSTNFCPTKIDLSGNSVWPQASRF